MDGCFQIYHLQQKLKYYLHNLIILTGKNIAINLKKINFKIEQNRNIFFKKAEIKILFLAITNQTLQVQKCKNIIEY